MNLMFYITSIERGGGAERVICNLANSFSRLGHHCTMVTSEDSDQIYELDNNITYIPLGKGRMDGFLKRNITLYRGLRKLVIEKKPDVLISFMAEPNFRAIPACRGTETKVLISVRNDPDREYPTLIHRFIAKHLFRKADFTVFQTKDAQAWFPEKVHRKSEVVPNQVDYRFYETKLQGQKADIVTTGRLEPQKNHRMLIDAFSRIADRISDNLIIIGEGSLRPALENQIRELGLTDRVLLPGRSEDVPASIGNAKLYVLSSDFEGMPNALMEAMALGLPCISTDCPCGGPKELINDGESGFLVPVNNPETLASKMLEVLDDAELREKFGREAAKTARRFYPDIVFEQWKKIITDLAGIQ